MPVTTSLVTLASSATIATLIAASTTATPTDPTQLTIQNQGTITCYIGGAGALASGATTGIKIASGAEFGPIPITNTADQYYGFVGTGATANCNIVVMMSRQ